MRARAECFQHSLELNKSQVNKDRGRKDEVRLPDTETVEQVSKPVIAQDTETVEQVSKPVIAQDTETVEQVSKPVIAKDTETVEQVSKPVIAQDTETVEQVSKPLTAQDTETVEQVSKPLTAQGIAQGNVQAPGTCIWVSGQAVHVSGSAGRRQNKPDQAISPHSLCTEYAPCLARPANMSYAAHTFVNKRALFFIDVQTYFITTKHRTNYHNTTNKIQKVELCTHARRKMARFFLLDSCGIVRDVHLYNYSAVLLGADVVPPTRAESREPLVLVLLPPERVVYCGDLSYHADQADTETVPTTNLRWPRQLRQAAVP
ncbi:hypothetical protein EGW08_001861 [Elysia chlorotica]|uniref:Uncharacterized protein n=1 Tax=Elysia chlorotica TaxID=188477 RepID=A0A433U9B7_ELYCH|nr:hypothetical protein EGW08_001861 [Elysia chlorotica]